MGHNPIAHGGTEDDQGMGLFPNVAVQQGPEPGEPVLGAEDLEGNGHIGVEIIRETNAGNTSDPTGEVA